MKRAFLLLILVLPIILMGQASDSTYAVADTLYSQSFTGVLGSVTADGIVYSQIRLMPEFRLWKFWIGLDLDFLIDAEGNVRPEDWDEWQDLFYKIYYLRLADRDDPLYFKAINIDDYTLGQGLVMRSYTNTLRYPKERSIGGFAGVNTSMLGLGMEVFTHDIVRNQILAGRVHLKPLSPSRLPFLRSLDVGANVVIDRDQRGKYPDTDGDGIPDVYDSFPRNKLFTTDTDGDGFADEIDIDIDGDNNLDSPSLNSYVESVYPGIGEMGYDLDESVVRDSLASYSEGAPLRIYSLDYSIDLIDNDKFRLYNYGEIAQIEGFGSGYVFPGFGAKFWILDANLELRRFSDGFLPAYFDNLYDDQRSHNYMDTDPDTGREIYYIRTKDEALNSVKAAVGWYGSLGARLGNFARFSASYQDMYGENLNTGKSLIANLEVYPTFIRNLEQASIGYAQKNRSYIHFLKLRTPGAELSGSAVYRIAANANLRGTYSEHYFDVNNDGLINSKAEIIQKLSFGVEFVF